MSINQLVMNSKIISSNVPVDLANNAVTGDYVSMKGYGNLAVILHFGAVGTGVAITMKQATDVGNSLSDEKALAYSKIYANVGLTTDTLTETTVTSNTYTFGNDPNQLYVIEVKADELDVNNGFDCARVNIAAGTGTTLLSCLYILYNNRYSGLGAPSAIVD